MKIQKTKTTVYLNTEAKEQAKEIYAIYGLGLSDAFNIFLAQSIMEGGIPFDVKIPDTQANNNTNEEVHLVID